jgi:hypothetical protein
MDVDEFDIANWAATESTPRFRDPLLTNKSINQDVKVGHSALVKLEDGNERHRLPKLAADVDTELGPAMTQKLKRVISLDVGRI